MNTPTTGGAERHTFDLAGALREDGFDAAIFAMKAGELAPPEGVPLLQPEGSRRLPGRIGDLARTIRERRPDVVVAVNLRPVLAAYLARGLVRARSPARPAVAAIWHTTVLPGPHEERMQIVYTPLLNRIDELVFISENQRRFWRARGIAPRRETVILNGIDVDHFSPEIRAAHRDRVRAELGFAPGDVVFGLCAVMRPEKNHVQLVEAVARLRADGFPAKVLFVGDGPTRPAVEQRARDLDVTTHVTFAGMQREVRPHVAAFDVGVLCSVSVETLSLSALEIMAMGVPMVMSDLGGASEIVDGTNGRLFPVGDTARLCEALRDLASREERDRAGARARRTVETAFDRRRMNRAYADKLSAWAAGPQG